jgi:hypothetical protein
LVTLSPIFSVQRAKNRIELADRVGQKNRTQMLIPRGFSQVFVSEQLRDGVYRRRSFAASLPPFVSGHET